MRNKKKRLRVRDVQDVLDVIGGRWRGPILASLCEKQKRFNELQRDLHPITPRILTRELKYLEMNKLVFRSANGKTSSVVVYGLTPHGQSLDPVIDGIVAWAQKHRKEVLGYK
ncbi:MAG TPA: helix-turn-helix domain-containing protein [bacterium]|nr:helix-turn-helix domain-containing protein [bacterium]HNH30945.1 helix-turn-helix domain-containing protein [bacterium]